MPRPFKFFVFAFAILALAPLMTLAQNGNCPEIVKTALAAADQVCQSTGRNQACYGNVDMTAQAQAGATNFSFSKVGDIVDVTQLQSLILSPMDEAAGKWGVALLRLQANIPDTLPGQNVTFLLFGDVEIINGVTPDNASTLRPMQAFYLRTSIGDSHCEQAPQSGMLVQTPKGAGEVTFNVNGVDVQMGSTVFFQAEPKKDMTVRTLEGAAYITAKNKTRVIVPGTRAKVPLGQSVLDQSSGGGGAPAVPAPPVPLISLPGEFISMILDLLPSGEPEKATSYSDEASTFESLPLNLLDRQIEIAPPLTDEEVDQINDQADKGILCGDGSLPECPTFVQADGTECVLFAPPGDTRPECDPSELQSLVPIEDQPGNDASIDDQSSRNGTSVSPTDQPDNNITSGDTSGESTAPPDQSSSSGDSSGGSGSNGGGNGSEGGGDDTGG